LKQFAANAYTKFYQFFLNRPHCSDEIIFSITCCHWQFKDRRSISVWHWASNHMFERTLFHSTRHHSCKHPFFLPGASWRI